MTEKEIIEGNCIIGQFDGWQRHVNRGNIFSLNASWLNNEKSSAYVTLDKFKYHSSWDWLMPVVQKIESLGHSVAIFKGCCDIEVNGLDDAIQHGGGQPKIKSTFDAIIEFIKWYNLQSPKP